MSTNCLVTKLKSVVDNNNLLKLDEFRLVLYSGKTVIITWLNYNADTCKVRAVSGSITSTPVSDGYQITAGDSDCVLIFSNKGNIWKLYSPNGESTPIMELDAEQFHGYNLQLENLSRCKLYGDITPLFAFIYRSDYCDFSDAIGELDIWRMGIFFAVAGNSDVSIMTHTNIVNATYIDAFTTFKAGNPISLSALTSSGLRSFTIRNVHFTGNVETDLTTFANLGSIVLNGPTLTGRLEKWVEKMADVKAVGTKCRVQSDSSNMTLIGRSLNNSNYLFTFNADDITITIADYPTVVGRYNKSTQTWAWED